MRQQSILDEYMQTLITGVSANSVSLSDKYKSLILKFVNILCEKKYRNKAMEYVSREYFPIEDCLKICEQKGVKDACAVLYKRKGEYQKSITLYVEVLTKLSKDKVISAVCINPNVPFNHSETKNTNILRFDEILTMIIDICDKQGSRYLEEKAAEDLWLFSIDKIYLIKQDVMDELQGLD